MTTNSDGAIILPHDVELYLHHPAHCRLGASGMGGAEFCVIHSPSDHPLKMAPIWIEPTTAYAYRICDHAQYHPDPDSQAWSQGRQYRERWRHRQPRRCDGCCT